MPSAEFSVYKAWQNALQADAALTAMIPAANIIIGPRKDDAPVPSICITTAARGVTTATQGAKITGKLYTRNPTFQFEAATEYGMTVATEITEATVDIALSDNSILNAVGITEVIESGFLEYYDERSLLCRTPMFSFKYHFIRTV